MPSFRCEVDVEQLRPGVRPEHVLPAAEAVMATRYRVEDRSVELVGIRPQVHLRYLVPPTNTSAEDAEAKEAILALIRDLDPVAVCGRWVLKRGPGRNWRFLTKGEAGEAWVDSEPEVPW